MSIRSQLAIAAGKSSQWFLKTFLKGGSSFPGQLALKIDPNVLSTLARDYEVIVVSGTNGKTLTTSLIVNILKQEYGEILTNPTGANLQQGIVATFLSAKKNNQTKNFAVLEIDEATLKHVTKYITPDVFVFTNIFRDQLDRYGEIYTTYQLLVEGAKNAPDALIVSNGDSPIFNSVDLVNPQKFYGFNHVPDGEMMADENTDGVLCPHCHNILHYKMITYANQGKYYCPSCDFKRPQLDYQLTDLIDITNHSSRFVIDGEEYNLEVGGMYNIYNALAAVAVGEYYGISPENIRKGLAYNEKVFGRQEVIHVNGKECTIMLVKNPVGLNQVLETIELAPQPFGLVSILNDHYADGIDVSWIWDGHYEKLAEMDIPEVVTGGTRVKDMTLRLKVAGLEDRIKVQPDANQIVSEIEQMNSDRIYILATYTAMLDLRKAFQNKGYLKEGMN